jgi:hypothetical protein
VNVVEVATVATYTPLYPLGTAPEIVVVNVVPTVGRTPLATVAVTSLEAHAKDVMPYEVAEIALTAERFPQY